MHFIFFRSQNRSPAEIPILQSILVAIKTNKEQAKNQLTSQVIGQMSSLVNMWQHDRDLDAIQADIKACGEVVKFENPSNRNSEIVQKSQEKNPQKK